MNRLFKIKWILLGAFCVFFHKGYTQTEWALMQKIERNIRPPQFKKKEYTILSFGAKPDGKADCRPAINKAIQQCHAQGGGRVVIPKGNYYIKGPIVLKSGVNLHLQEGAVLTFSSEAQDYLPVVFTRWEGTELYNYSPLIYAYKATNIAITGKGLLNGMGTANFATWKPDQKKDQQALREMGRTGAAVKDRVFGKGHYLRPAFLELVECSNILIEDIKLINATFWVIHPVYCNNVTVRGVTVNSRNLNSDGCDPESSTNVLIENCHFITGDDGIAIKSGRDNDGWRVNKPTENVIIRNCSFNTETNAVCIGSEISGGVRNVFVENIKIEKAGNGIYFKSNLDRGGFIEDIFVRNVKADSTIKSVIKFEPDYKSESKQNHPTRFNNFVLEAITANYGGEYAIDITGFKDLPVNQVTIRDMKVAKALKPLLVKNATNVNLHQVQVNGKPVSLIQANKTISLNGQWDVSLQDKRPESYAAKVPVPGVTTMAKPALGKDLDGIDQKEISYKYVWYRRSFQLHEAAYPEALLKIRAKYNVAVWLNGVEIGYDHHTTYSHAAFDISKALNYSGDNELVVRVGSWATASAPSKENAAEWWRNSRAPGIWDDVLLELGQPVNVQAVKIIPDLKQESTAVTVTLSNRLAQTDSITVIATILDGPDPVVSVQQRVAMKGTTAIEKELRLNSSRLQQWSAGREGNPKLYQMQVAVLDAAGRIVSVKTTPFGYRSIAINGKDVLVNGRKIFFRSENIAFVRALTRWPYQVFDEDWIRKFLTAAVQEYNLNYLRVHLGHAYSRWYKIADEVGIMLQDEWRYMHDDEPIGRDKDEAVIELTRWVKQNVNHPSIVTWDQENEGHVRLTELRAALKQYDPTRLWGEDDFEAKHIYQYSENIITDPSTPIPAAKPGTILESCRLWTNEFGLLEPRENFKTSRTSSGWGVYYYSRDLIGQLLADLHADLGTYYRSARLQAWAPFALLSGWVNGQNFYQGNIADSLTPQPNLIVLKQLNEPVGISIKMLQAREWYKDQMLYRPGARTSKLVVAWNDFAADERVQLTIRIKKADGTLLDQTTASLLLPAYKSDSVYLAFVTPKRAGMYLLEPVLTLVSGKEIKGPVRRIMVAEKMDPKLTGYRGWGGSRTPLPGGQSIIEHFLGFEPAPAIATAVIKQAGDGLVDKIEFDKKEKTYQLQSTRYINNTRAIITKSVIDKSGRIISANDTEALNYVDLPPDLKKIIATAIGAIPMDESRILKTSKNADVIYEITFIGSDSRYRLTISPDGALKNKEIIKKNIKK